MLQASPGRRVLWLGDAGCTSGFATVTHAIGDRLVNDYGHDIHVLATNYKGDHWPTPLKLYVPTLRDARDTYGTSRFLELLDRVNPEVIVSLNDPLVILRNLFKNPRDTNLLMARYAPIIAYMPIDGINYPEIVTKTPDLVAGLTPLDGANTTQPMMLPVLMSHHGNVAFPGAPVVYHGVDTEFFAPLKQRPAVLANGITVSSKAEAKRLLQLDPDVILAVRVDRNSLRKNYADTVIALAAAMRKEPKLHAWLHCKDEDSAGVDLNLVVSRFPDVEDRFHWPGRYDTSQGWEQEALRAVYAAGDLFVSTSGGEGFGLTLAEAASMELPIVALNVSAIPEVVGPGGILLDPDRTYVPLSGQDNWLPNVAAFTDAILRLTQSRGLRRTLGEAGRKHVTTFTWDEAAARFDKLITGVVQKASGDTVPVLAGGAA